MLSFLKFTVSWEARGSTVRNYFPYCILLRTYRTVILYLAKIRYRYETVRYGIFPYRNTVPFRITFFQPIYAKKISAGNFCHSRIKVQIYRPFSLAVERILLL